MTEQDKPLRHSHAPRELDEVPLSVLHDAGTDHTGVPGPFDEYIGDDDVLYIDAQQANHGEHHDLAGEGKHHVHHPHDDLFHHAPEVAGHNAQQRAQCDGPQHGQKGKSQRWPDAVNQAGEDAPAQMVCAQWVLQAVRREFVEDIRNIGIMRRQERGKNADQRDQEDESHRHHSGTVVQKAFSHGSALLSQSGVGHGLKDVEHQIEYHEQYADKQHIGLDHRQVPVEDRADAQGPQSRPGEHILHHDSASNHLGDAHTHGHDAGVHGIFEHMFHPDGALGEASDVGVEHIVLLHILQHIVADESDIGGNIAQRHGEGGEDQVPQRTAAVGGQHAQFDADQPHEQQAHPVGGHGSGDKDQPPHQFVEPLVLIHRAEEADRDAQHQHDDKGSSRQL